MLIATSYQDTGWLPVCILRPQFLIRSRTAPKQSSVIQLTEAGLSWMVLTPQTLGNFDVSGCRRVAVQSAATLSIHEKRGVAPSTC